MEVTAARAELLPALAQANAVADHKSPLPILTHVRLTAGSGGWLQLEATDLCVTVRTRVSAKVRRPGAVTLSARTLFEVVRGLPECDVEFTADGADEVRIRCAEFRYRLPGNAGSDFPALPDPGAEAFDDVEAAQLRRLIILTRHSMARDEARPQLSATLVEADGNLMRVVATDGHRLAKAEARAAVARSFAVLVPRTGVEALVRLLEAEGLGNGFVGLAIAGNMAFFRYGAARLSVKLSDPRGFPPYGKIIPASAGCALVVDRDALADALRRATLVDRGGVVRLDAEPGQLRMRCERAEVGEGTALLGVSFEGTPIALGLHAQYLADALAGLPAADIVLELGGELDPCVVRSRAEAGFVGVIMPMRL